MKVERLQEEMRSLGRKTILSSICFTEILLHLIQKINNNNKLTIFLILLQIIFYVESYKSSTTRKNYRKSRTRAAIGKTDLKNCIWSFPKIENRQLILAECIKTAFRSKRGTWKAVSAALTYVTVNYALFNSGPVHTNAWWIYSIRTEKQKAHLFFLN